MFNGKRLIDWFTRTPRRGGRKEMTMPDVQTNPEAKPTAPAPDARDDLAKQLATLTDAMRQLAESQKALTEVVKGQGAETPGAPGASPAPRPGAADIGGDPAGGGVRPAAVVDYSRLSPVQQITLGLKDASPRPAPRAAAGAD